MYVAFENNTEKAREECIGGDQADSHGGGVSECPSLDDERPTIPAQHFFFCNCSAEPTNHAKGTKRKPRTGN